MSTTKINFTDINIKDFIKYIVKFDNVDDILDTFHSSKKKLVINQVSDIINKFKLYKTSKNINEYINKKAFTNLEARKEKNLNKHFVKFKNKIIKNKTNIYEKYSLYKQNRKKINMKFIDNTFTFDKNAKVAIIIPYRNREEHLKEFAKHFTNENFDVYVIEQFDTQKFNRGLLLNAGFNIASKKKKYDYYIFHDVDTYPDKDLLAQYYYKGTKIIHYASPYLNSIGSKYNFPDLFGGVIGMNKDTFLTINGFPNNFYGWGGEDDALYNHVALSNFDVYRPNKGSYILADHAEPTNEEVNKNKMINILKDLKNWTNYGYKDIENLYILENNFKYPESTNKVNIEVYQLKIAIVHLNYPEYYSLLEPLLSWDEVNEKIIRKYNNITKFNKKDNKINQKKEIEEIINKKIDSEYKSGLDKTDLEKTLKLIFETYREILYFRIRNNKIELSYYLNNRNYKNAWNKYIKFPNQLTPSTFLDKRRNELKYNFEPLLPEDKWVANNCIVKIEGTAEEGNPISYIKEIYEMISNTIKYFKNVPDCDLLINRKDFQYLHSDPSKYAHTYIYPNNISIPDDLLPNKYWIVCSQNSTNENKDVPIPNADEWKDIHKSMDKIEWSKKNEMVLFRGSSTGCGLDENSNPRIRLSEISYLLNKPFYNIGLSKFVKKIRIDNFTYSYIDTLKYKHLIKDFITPDDQLKAKYILNIEGNAAAYRLAGLFNMNSVVIQAESKYYNWFEPLLEDNKDYIILKKKIFMDENDNIEKSKKKVDDFFISLKDENMKKIALNGTKFYEKYLNEKSIYEYYFALMKKINSFQK